MIMIELTVHGGTSSRLDREVRGLLLYPPNQLMDVETPRPDGSLGLLYLSSALERNGIYTDILDSSVGGRDQTLEDTFNRRIRQDNGLIRIGMDFDEIAEYVAKGNYDFVGINSNFTPQTRMSFETARAIKQATPKVKVYAGGINARALKERFLKTGDFDGICLTEGELIFPRMIEAHFSGHTLRDVAGVAYMVSRRIIVNPVDSTCFPETLDDLAMPDWGKLPFDKYETIASPHGVDVTDRGSNRYGPIMTSRGCPFKCLFCHISDEKRSDDMSGAIGKLRLHSEERVLEEMKVLKSLGVERLFFEDDSLLANKNRVKSIFTKAKDMGFSISDVNGVNLIHFYNLGQTNVRGQWEIDREYLEILKGAGFDQIVFPVESGSQRILQKYATGKTDLKRMNLIALMEMMSDMEIRAPVNMMIGFPDETEEEIRESIDFSHRLMEAGAPYVTFFHPIPFPGSRLYQQAIDNGHLDRDFDHDIMNWKHPVMKNTTVPPERLEEIGEEANRSVNTNKHLIMRERRSAGHRLATISEF